MKNKIELGQYYTQKNIFNLPGFLTWWNTIPENKKSIVLEPFAGSNNIIKSLKEIGLIKNYISYDIEPQESSVIKLDTIKKFPKGYSCVITNPPYLSKTSATRKNIKITYPKGIYDMYEIALNECLKNVEYIAAIIPESFITTNRFKSRVHSIISLTYKDMFFDTTHPVCLVMFSPEKDNDFKIYRNEFEIGYIRSLSAIKDDLFKNNKNTNIEIKFNDKNGNISLLAVDNNVNESGILFSDKELVLPEEVKGSSRAKTRVSIYNKGSLISSPNEINKIVNNANITLKNYRIKTGDIFMTSFKGLRKDGLYRRRLDYKTAKDILLKSLS